MTESEWMACDDPALMLQFARGRLSDRQLRLFACAYFRSLPPRHGNWRELVESIGWSERVADGLPFGEVPPAMWGWRSCSGNGAACASWVTADVEGDPEAQKCAAHFLRDVVGNPFRSVTLPKTQTEIVCDSCGRVNPTVNFSDLRCLGCGRGVAVVRRETCSWLTPDVLTLATAAYDQRGRKCDDPICRGRGRWADAAGDMDDCQKCGGTGTLDAGTIDPLTLAALADALEEAGCAGTECDECVDGDVGCSACGGAGYYYEPPYSLNRLKCPKCDKGLLPEKCRRCNGNGLVAHPIVAHLRSAGPHVRGCWCLDLLSGKE